ncbi:PfkB family carbohydrate kinase [Actinokineospora fastidiosa]|uniref:Ribokinase n=1 Tax=Actinokineospora fastidiosa TaxID=1816 RepID=A0A918GDT4_9PSEU|nr:PfkB family carbohydrate kinase [Actinokineospora fastidiosa]GGS30871.1 ribokinase [Actinokineospora fastidiosa]
MTATARRQARICRERYLAGFGGELDIVVVGQIARDIVLLVDELPGARAAADVRERRELLGGKGANQAVACAQLGASVALLGVVGDDEVGTALLAQARADHIDVVCVVHRPEGRTALIVNVVERGGAWRYLEDFAGTELTEAEVEGARGTLVAASSVIVQLQQPAALAAATIARDAGRRVVLDGAPPADQRADLLATADVVRADAKEAALLTGSRMDSVDTAVRAARSVLAEGPSMVALAVEAEGDLFAWPDGHVFIPYTADPTVDTTGAGDSLIAALTVALTRGESPEAAARAAAAAAGSTVGHLGGRPALGRA